MKSIPLEIKGIWHNDTNAPIAVSVNGTNYSGIIPSRGYSAIMTMKLTDIMTLDLLIANETMASNPILLWENSDGNCVSILQQKERYGLWEHVPISDRKLLIYVFNIEVDDDGLVIVGTVELVEQGVLA